MLNYLCYQKKTQQNNKILLAFSLVVFFYFVSTGFFYGLQTYTKAIRADEWRFIELYLFPFYDGTFSIKTLFSDKHSGWFNGAVFILDAKFFDLSGSLYFYIGMVSKAIVFLILLFSIRTYFGNDKPIYLFAFIAIGFVFYGLKDTTEYNWPLVTRANFFVLLFMFVLIFANNFITKNNFSHRVKYGFLLAISSIMLCLSHRSPAVVMLISLCGALSTILFFEFARGKIDKDIVKVLGIVIFSAIIYVVLHKFILQAKFVEVSGATSLNVFSKYPEVNYLNFIKAFPLAISAGVLDISLLRNKFGNDAVFYISYSFFFLYGLVFLHLFKSGLYRKNIIPVVLMIYPLVFTLSVSMFRYIPMGPEFDWRVISPRYIRNFELGMVGFVWAFFGVFINKTGYKFELAKYTIIALLTFLYMNNLKGAEVRKKHLTAANERVESAIINYSGNKESIPIWVRGSSFSDEKIKFLKENNLNIFSDRYKTR